MSEQRDQAGQVYNSPSNSPASSGTAVGLVTNNGVVAAHMVGNIAVPDKY